MDWGRLNSQLQWSKSRIKDLPPHIFVIILLTMIFPPNLMLTVSKAETITVPTDYPTIQTAIDMATPGDTINVSPGTYNENLRITKSLNLIGQGPNNTIITSNGIGTVIFVVKADNVKISGFTVKGGTYGIFLSRSNGTILRNNIMTSNKWNFGVWGDSLSHFVHDIDASNLVDKKPMYYWIDQHDKSVPTDAGYVALVNCSRITVRDLETTSNEQGVLLLATNEALIANITIRGNDQGIVLRMANNNTIKINNLVSINFQSIYLEDSHDNIFFENTLNNGTTGVDMTSSSGNIFYHNNFLARETQVFSANSSNVWNQEEEGNYWSDYVGRDTNGDGIGDTMLPHLGLDHYPLVNIFDRISPAARARIEADTDPTFFKNTIVILNASDSWDNTAIVSYEWNFGDGSKGFGVTIGHTYKATGVYTVTLNVTDLGGNSSIDAFEITVVENSMPQTSWILTLGIAIVFILIAIFWMRKSAKTAKTNNGMEDNTKKIKI